MQKLAFVRLVVLLIPFQIGVGQDLRSICQAIYDDAKIKMDSGEYDLAIKKLTAFKICASSATEIRMADDLIGEVYSRVNQQRIDAENERNRARKERDNAIKERKRAEREALNAKISLMVARSENQLGKNNTLAFRYAEQGYNLSPTTRNSNAYAQLLDCYSKRGSFFKRFNPKILNKSVIYHMSFSPGDSLLLITGSDTVSVILDLTDGTSVELIHQKRPVKHGSFSSDGKLVVTAGRGIDVFNLKGENQKTFHPDGYFSFAQFLKNDTQILLASANKVCLIDWVTEAEIFCLNGPGKEIIRAAFSDNEKFLATSIRSDSTKSNILPYTSGGKSRVSIYDVRNRVPYLTEEFDGIIYSMDFLNSDKLILGSWNGDILEWDIVNRSVRKINSSRHAIPYLATRFQNNIIFIDSDYTLREITNDDQEVGLYNGIEFFSGVVAISQGQETFACSNGSVINLYTSYPWAKDYFNVADTSGTAVRMLINPANSDVLVIQYDSDKLILRNIQNGKKKILKDSDNLGGYASLQASFSSSGKDLIVNTAIFSQHGMTSMKRFDVTSMAEINQNLNIDNDSIIWFCYSPSGQLVTKSRKSDLLKWRREDGSVDWSYSVKGRLINFSYDGTGRQFAILKEDSVDQVVELVEYKSKSKLLFRRPKGTIANIALSDDGSILAYIHGNLLGIEPGGFIHFIKKDSTVKISDQIFDSVSISAGNEPLALFGSSTPVLTDLKGNLIFIFDDIEGYVGSMMISRDGMSFQYLGAYDGVFRRFISPTSIINEVNAHGIWDGEGVKSLMR